MSLKINQNTETWLIMPLFLLTITSVASAKTIYVDPDAIGSNNGTSWANAYPYLQDALADANASAKPVEIRVAQGTYKPDEGAGVTDGDREAMFGLINGVTLKGGYAGDGEPDPNARDITNYETILSGDLDGNDVPVPDPCDLVNHPTRAENSYHVATGTSTNATAVLDGFTITAGNADGSPSHEEGGGMHIFRSSLLVTKCTFVNNSASDDGGGAYNVGLFGADDGPTLTNCTFFRNATVSRGGGLAYIHGSRNLVDCTFANNWAGKRGGGMYIRWSSPTLTNSTFIDNSADNDGGAVLTILLVGDTPEFTNCIFSGNSARNDGGAIVSTHDYSIFTNCTFSENSGGGDGGVYCISYNGGTPDFNNCILWGNTARGQGPQIAIKTASAAVSVNYCAVQGGELDIYVSAGTLNYDSNSNIDVDPCFVDADGADDTVGTEDDNLRLTNGSPCIDAGDNTAVPADTTDLDGDGNTAEPTPLDLNGFARFIDDLCTADTGNPGPPGPIVDMGAYEFLRSDIDSNGSVRFEDYCVIADRWRQTSCGLCGGADLTR
jgi:predicted outer membrane repeat protein